MKKKLFILVNTLSFFVSHRLEIAIAAKDKGYDVKIGYGELGNIKTSILSKKGIDCFKLPLNRKVVNPFLELWSLFYIWQIFYKQKPDIVHLITIKPYLYGGIAARLAKIPAVVSAVAGLGILFNQKNLKNFFLKKFLYIFFYLAFRHPNQKIITQNLEDKKLLANWIGLSKKKFLLFPGSGVNLSAFKKLKETKGIVNICFASRLLRDKGVYDFISAAKIIHERKIKARFLLAGNLDLENPTSLTKQDLRIIKKKKFIKFLGYEKDIPALYSRSHIICLPSYYGEGVPKTLIEAAAASRVVVTTDHSGCRDSIIANKTGFLIPIRNPKKLADSFQWLIEHPRQRILMGKAGRKMAERKFDIHKIIQMHLKTYKLLLKKIS